MPRTDRHLRVSVFAVGLSLTVTVASAYLAGWLDEIEAGLYDRRAQHFQRFTPPPTDKIVHVDIDDATLEVVGAWPWPRTVMADLVDEMAAAGAKAIALDVIYAEPQERQWEPTDKAAGAPADGGTAAPAPGQTVVGRFRAVDHDANLAAAFARAGNVFLPASLLFIPAHAQTPATAAALTLLTERLELSSADLSAALVAKGFAPADVAGVEVIYFDLRREAARARVERELGGLPATPATGPATSPPRDPATAPATSPAPAASLAATGDTVAVKLALRKALFPGRDPTVASPESRLVDDAYEHLRAARQLTRFGRPPVEGAAVYRARNQILPAPALIGSAAASGFVDYPNLGEGTVRSVPLLMQYRGRVFAQMGLRVACQLLEVEVDDLRVTPDGVTIPAGTLRDGTPRRELTIPVRTISRTFTGGRAVEFPLVMDIPWFGGRQWYAMYDRGGGGAGTAAGPRKSQHLPLSAVYAVVRTRQRIEQSTADLGRAVEFLLVLLDQTDPTGQGKRLAAYKAAPPAADDAEAWGKLIAETLAGIDALVPPDASPDDPQNTPQDRRAILSARALRTAATELPKFRAQLAELRAELRRALAGRAAVVGWTAVAAVADQKPTPLHAAAPGVVIHGVIASALLTGDVWRTASPWVTAGLVLLLGGLTTAAVARLAPVFSLVAAVVLLGGYVAVNCYALFDYGNLIVDLGAPVLGVAVPWSGATITRLIIEARERARITRRFSTYVDPDIVNYYLEVRDEAMFSGQRRDTAIVFTDLEGFTTLSERLGEDIVPLLNDFMGRAVTVIKRHRGLVNKFLGDGILFFFNAPKPNASYVPDAIDAILDLQVMMVGFNEELAKQKLPRLRLRAGVAAGQAVTGDAGTSERADYTVIGNLVNLTARLESANKSFGTSNLVTEDAVRGAGDRFLFRPIGVVQVVGLHTGVMVYETLAWAKDATDRERELAERTREMVDAFTAGQAAECLAAVGRLEEAFGPSKLTKVYREMCEPFAAGAADGAAAAVGEMPRQIVLDAK